MHFAKGGAVARQKKNAVVKQRREKVQKIQYAAVELASKSFLFRAEREQIFRPRRGSTLEHAWKIGRLTYLQQHAWNLLIREIMDAKGASGGVTSSYSEKVDIQSNGAAMPVAYTNRAYQRMEFLMQRYLSRKEYALLRDLLYDELTKPGVVGLNQIGFWFAGYKDNAQARAAGVGVIGCLLDRIAEFYRHHGALD